MAREQTILVDGQPRVFDLDQPEHVAWLERNKSRTKAAPSAPTEGAGGVGSNPFVLGKNLLRIGTGLVKVPFLPSDLANFTNDLSQAKLGTSFMSPEFRAAHKGSGWVDEGLDAAGTSFHRPTQGDRGDEIVNAMAQGAGGGLGGLLRTASPRLMLAPTNLKTAARGTQAAVLGGGVGAGAGNVAGHLTGVPDPQTGEIVPNPVADIATALVTGGGVGHLAGRTAAPQRLVSDKLQSMNPADWAQAHSNLDKLSRSGSTTYTLLDALPGGAQSPLRATGDVAAQSGKGGALAERVRDRQQDLADLARRAVDEGLPPATRGGRDVAHTAGQVAETRLQQLRNFRSQTYRQLFSQAGPIDPANIRQLSNALTAEARATESAGRRAVLTEIERVLRSAKGGLKTSPEAVAYDLKQFQEELKANDYMVGGKRLEAGAVNTVYKLVNDHLRQWSPEYQAAEDAYRLISERMVNPRISGPLGLLAGRNHSALSPMAVEKLAQLTKDMRPEDVSRLLTDLEAGTRGAGRDLPRDPALVQEVARALLDKRKAAGGDNLATQLRGGTADSANAEATRQLVAGPRSRNAAGAARFDELLDVYDLLSPRPPNPNSTVEASRRLGENWVSKAVAPFRTIAIDADRRATQASAERIARLLLDTSHKGLLTLEDLASYDPGAAWRKGLFLGATSAANAGSREKSQ